MSNTYNLGRIGLKLRGEYNADVAYEKLDVVTYNNSSYAAMVDNPANAPTDTASWQLLAQGNPVITYTATLPATGIAGQIVFVPVN